MSNLYVKIILQGDRHSGDDCFRGTQVHATEVVTAGAGDRVLCENLAEWRFNFSCPCHSIESDVPYEYSPAKNRHGRPGRVHAHVSERKRS